MSRVYNALRISSSFDVIRFAMCCVSRFMTLSFKAYKVALIALVVIMAVGVHAQADLYKGYEIPPYQTVETDGDIEVRDYASHVVAEVDVRGTRTGAIQTGFRILAGYIFGGNSTSEKIAMTVPVSQHANDGAWTIRFMMPAAYTIDTLPKPDSDAVRFVETAPERHLVVRFSGRPQASVLAEMADRLMNYAREQGITPTGSPAFHFYDDPFTLPWKRRNEVSLPIG